jgi:hypothetical protein
MSLKEIYGGYLGKIANIGIPHKFNFDQIFFLTGTVIEVNENFLLIQTKKELHRVNLSEIITIKEGEHNAH